MLRRITLSPTRLGLFPQLLANRIGSISSLLELLLIYGFMTTSAPLSEAAIAGYLTISRN
jgi:hypothetical protein